MSHARYFGGERVSVHVDGGSVRLSCNVCAAEAALAADPTTLFLHDMETFLADHASCEASAASRVKHRG